MTSKDISLFKGNKTENNNFRIITEALLNGQKVKIKNKIYMLAETTYKSPFQLCFQYVDQDIILGENIDFSELYYICSKLTFDEVFIISSNTALNKINKI